MIDGYEDALPSLQDMQFVCTQCLQSDDPSLYRAPLCGLLDILTASGRLADRPVFKRARGLLTLTNLHTVCLDVVSASSASGRMAVEQNVDLFRKHGFIFDCAVQQRVFQTTSTVQHLETEALLKETTKNFSARIGKGGNTFFLRMQPAGNTAAVMRCGWRCPH